MPTTVGRWGLRVPVGGDAPQVPLWLTNLATDLSNVAMDNQGTLAARPVSTAILPSNKPGRYWYVTGDSDPLQNGRLWRDTGVGWVEVAMNRRPALTALPGSPTTGDEILYQDAAMIAAGIGPWHFRYRAGSASPYKWEFSGGAALEVELDAKTAFTAHTVYTAIAGIAIAMPALTGVFDIRTDATISIVTAGPASCDGFLCAAPAGVVTDTKAAQAHTEANLGETVSVSKVNRFAAASAATISMYAKTNNPGAGYTFYASGMRISVLPVRVG